MMSLQSRGVSCRASANQTRQVLRVRQHSRCSVVLQSGDGSTAASQTQEASSKAAVLPPGAKVKVVLRQPVGIVFAQKKTTGPVIIDELVAGGAAALSGKLAVGDILINCSAVVLKTGMEGKYEATGYGDTPFNNWDTINFPCEGQDFKSVMGALKSNNPRWGIFNVTMEFKKPEITVQE